MVAEGQVGGQHEAGLADPASVKIEWRGEIVDLHHLGTCRAVLELQPHVGRSAIGHMHPELRLLSGAHDDGRRQWTRPVGLQLRGQGVIALLFGLGGNAEGGKSSHQCSLGDQHLPASPVRVLGGNAESSGKFDQRRRELGHVAHLASGTRVRASAGI